MEQKIERMESPTLVVGRKLYEELAYKRVSKIVLSPRKARKALPSKAQPTSEHTVVFVGSPKRICFRQRFTSKTCWRDVRYIEGDRSDRFNVMITVHFK